MEEALVRIDMLVQELVTAAGVVVSSRRDTESHTVKGRDILEL